MVRLLITNPPRYRPFGLAQCAFVQPHANRRDYVTKLPPAVSVCDGCYGRIAFSIHHRWETCRHYAAQSTSAAAEIDVDGHQFGPVIVVCATSLCLGEFEISQRLKDPFDSVLYEI